MKYIIWGIEAGLFIGTAAVTYGFVRAVVIAGAKVFINRFEKKGGKTNETSNSNGSSNSGNSEQAGDGSSEL